MARLLTSWGTGSLLGPGKGRGKHNEQIYNDSLAYMVEYREAGLVGRHEAVSAVGMSSRTCKRGLDTDSEDVH